MGSVTANSYDSGLFEGYPITVFTNCLYCDKCGSFRIRRRIIPKVMLGWVSAVTLFIITGLIFMQDNGSCFACLSLLAFILIVVIGAGAFPLGYKCRKCGNIEISKDNVLNYPDYDHSILDVPYEMTEKFTTSDN